MLNLKLIWYLEFWYFNWRTRVMRFNHNYLNLSFSWFRIRKIKRRQIYPYPKILLLEQLSVSRKNEARFNLNDKATRSPGSNERLMSSRFLSIEELLSSFLVLLSFFFFSPPIVAIKLPLNRYHMKCSFDWDNICVF